MHEYGDDLFFCFSQDGRVLHLNRAAREVLGYGEGGQIPATVDALVAPSDRTCLSRLLVQAAEGESPGEVEVSLLGAGGGEVLVSGGLLCCGNGHDVAVIGLFSLIQEDHQGERVFREMFYTSPTAMAVTSAGDGRCVMVNRAFSTLLGCGSPEVLGKTPEKLGIWTDPDDYFPLVRGLGGSGSFREMGVRLLHRDGTALECIVTARGLMLGGLPHNLLVIRTTDQARFHAILNRVNDAVVLHEIEEDGLPGRIVDLNERACSLFGSSWEDLTGRPFKDFLLVSEEEKVLSIVRALRDERRVTAEVMVLREDGREVPVEVSAHLYKQNGSEVVLSVMRDISERVENEKKIREANQRFNLLLDTLPELVYFKDREKRHLVVNNALAEMAGIPKEEIVGRTSAEFLPPAFAVQCDLTDTRLLRERTIVASRESVESEGGSVFTFDTTKIPVLDEHGEVGYFVGVSRDITEQKRAEEALRTSEAKYRMLFETASDAISIFDREGRFLEANRVTCERLGYSRDELLTMNRAEINTPVHRERIAGRIRTLFENGQVIYETDHLARDGRVIPTEVNWHLIEYEGRPAVLSIARDITERRRLEEELRRSVETYQTIFENTGTAMVLVDEDTTFVLVNSEMERIFGYRRDELEGRMQWTDLVVQEDLEKMQEYHTRRRKAWMSVPRRYECTAIARDGRHLCLLLTVSLVPGTEQSIASVIDITERNKVAEAFKEREERLRLVINGANLGVWDWDMVSGHLVLNERWAGMLGYSLSEVGSVSAAWDAMIHPDDSPKARSALASYLVGETLQYHVEYRMQAKDGHWVWMLSVGEVVAWDATGKPIRMVGINQDITDFKLSQGALKEANKKLTILSSVTRHDILNQVQGLLWFSSEIEGRTDKYPGLCDAARRIGRIAEMIQYQISFTRDYEEMGVKSPEWQQVEAIARGAALAALPAGVHLKVKTADLEVYADSMLRKVFYNLFENAVRHGGGITRVIVLFRKGGGKGTLVIEDDGVGVPEEKKPYIFKRGYGQHTGFGLFLVREILEITGMTIQETGVEGKGARFEITLPGGVYRCGEGGQE
ncbi:PAS domain S-box-containing protein [Methanofollis sp. W23]|uniref:PAS domain S-box protein n=1 Tax=Methanofollis sp. W23 TaxID=2817849 RepID=UPI001AE2220A|nr:PAS domain S-box protein [Methanofollis sp. W23]MBP2144677.1 PAS domain S-box-containing protein [Methanofollis sp. W23]